MLGQLAIDLKASAFFNKINKKIRSSLPATITSWVQMVAKFLNQCLLFYYSCK